MNMYVCLLLGVAMGISGGLSKQQYPSKFPLRDLAQEERNMELVINFEQLTVSTQNISVLDQYVAVDIIQHTATIADGIEAMKAFYLSLWAVQPKYFFYIESAVAQGDLVWLHLFDPITLNAVVTIWRVKGNKIVEHWDVVQNTVVPSANPHPFFTAFGAVVQQQCQYVLINPTNITLPLRQHTF